MQDSSKDNKAAEAAAPQSIEELADSLDRPLYDSLRTAVELGKWADGSPLTPAQVNNSLQLLILYETRHLPEAERLYSNLPTGCGAPAGSPGNNPGVGEFDPEQH